MGGLPLVPARPRATPARRRLRAAGPAAARRRAHRHHVLHRDHRLRARRRAVGRRVRGAEAGAPAGFQRGVPRRHVGDRRPACRALRPARAGPGLPALRVPVPDRERRVRHPRARRRGAPARPHLARRPHDRTAPAGRRDRVRVRPDRRRPAAGLRRVRQCPHATEPRRRDRPAGRGDREAGRDARDQLGRASRAGRAAGRPRARRELRATAGDPRPGGRVRHPRRCELGHGGHVQRRAAARRPAHQRPAPAGGARDAGERRRGPGARGRDHRVGPDRARPPARARRADPACGRGDPAGLPRERRRAGGGRHRRASHGADAFAPPPGRLLPGRSGGSPNTAAVRQAGCPPVPCRAEVR